MKVLLISPPFYRIIGFYNRYFPFGVTILGTVLKEADHDVAVYDADFNERPLNIDYSRLPAKYPVYLETLKNENHPVWLEVERAITDFKPDVVGISVFTTFAASAFQIAGITKKFNPSLTVVFGGPHATVKAEEVLKISHDVDYVIRGEGEETLLELLSALEHGNPALDSIQGLSYRKVSAIRHNPARERLSNLDRFPFPDRALLLNEKKYSSEDMGLIMTSRGCPYGCTYCATDTKRVSFRSVDNVLKEVMFVKEKYGTTQFTFKDDSFTVNKKRVIELCKKLIEADFKIQWECNTRVNLIDEDLLMLMKKAGCNFIKIGIESGSEQVLKIMQKGITLSQIVEAARLLKKAGIHWTGYFMMGMPGETKEDVYQTLKLMYKIKPDLALIAVYEPFPGTVMFEDGVLRGLIKPDMTLKDFYRTLPNHYYKKNPEQQTDTIDIEEFRILEKEMKEAFHKYNNSFRNIMRMARAKIPVYLKEPAIFFEDIRKYLGYISIK